jgi:hypothetical protein
MPFSYAPVHFLQRGSCPMHHDKNMGAGKVLGLWPVLLPIP